VRQTCQLCKVQGELLQSHILPEFVYRPLYDEKHRFTVVTEEGNRFQQKGLRERLLCISCERQLSRYEKYASEVMNGTLGHRFRQEQDKIIIENIDYECFKLFEISVLWRAAVSRQEFFKLVSLGPREEKLRAMLRAGDPGQPEDFGCVVIFAHDRGQDISDTIFNPESFRWAGRQMHKIYFAGAAWLFHCDQQAPVSHLKKFFLQRNGTLVGLCEELTHARANFSIAKRLARRNRLL
jgi:hypothetical protein